MSSDQKRPDPIHFLLDHLRELQIRMNNLGGKKGTMNVIEAYSYFVTESKEGRKCVMAQKAQRLFCQEDYSAIRELIERLSEDIRSCDGNN